MKKILLLVLATSIYNVILSQRITNFEKPWFEDEKVTYSTFKSNNPLLDNYDVKFYKIDLSVTNTSKYIIGSGTMMGRVVNNDMSTLVIDLNNSITIDSVVVNGTTLSYSHSNDEILINLPTSIVVGDYFTSVVYYHGTSTGSGIRNGTSPSWGAQITMTLSESYHLMDWFPCKQVLSDKADSAYIFITCANTLKAGSNGLLTKIDTLPGSKLRYQWKEYYPIDYYLLSFAVSNYQEYNLYAHPVGLSDSILIQNYLYSNSSYLPYFQAEIDNTPAFIELLSDLYGMYPFKNEKYGHCTAPIGGGMEHQTMTTLSSFSFELIIHELGHMWFGDHVTCSNWQDIWVNEGFATYTHYLGLQNLQTQADADQMMLDTHNDIMASADGSIYIPLADVFDENRIFDYRLTYEKGAAIIHTIRFILNDDFVFFSVLRNYQQLYGDSVASATDFKNTLVALSGMDFTDYFDQWYYGEGYPTYNIVWNQQGNDISLNINQQTSMPGITPFFKVPIEIRFSWAGGDTIIRFDQTYNNQQFSATIPQHAIQSLEVDPNNWIVNDVGTIITNYCQDYLSEKLIISPNPASEFINISLIQESLTNLPVLHISDITGKIVKQINLHSTNEKINISDLQNGVYFINSQNSNQYKNQKFVKIGK
jgi:aminopeptidase N